MLAIQTKNLTKSYPLHTHPARRLAQTLFPAKPSSQFHALKNLSLDVPAGQTLGIIGPNGSGKSTLLQLLAGTLTPTSGTVETTGRLAAILELGAGFHPEFTGRENAALNARLLGLTQSEVDQRLDAMLAFADIGQFIDQPVKSYSSGMFVRLAFAVIANVNADILIIDEALAVGDIFFTQKCFRFLRDFQAQNKTILLVSHDAPALTSLCHQILWLQNGELHQQGPPKEVLQNYLAQSQGFSPTARSTCFNLPSTDYGTRTATIQSVTLTANGEPLTHITGKEEVTLTITAQSHAPLTSPIVGFFLKDRLGQNLFGQNTGVSHPSAPVAANETITAKFHFTMPTLPAGDYTLTAAIADGTQHLHTILHWHHDACTLTSTTHNDALGLVGIPITTEIARGIGILPMIEHRSIPTIPNNVQPSCPPHDATSIIPGSSCELPPHLLAALTPPKLLSDFSAWIPHIPFAFTLIHLLRPRTFIELGTHNGDSYCAFCQAVQLENLATKATAIDTWTGDSSAGFYDQAILQNLRQHHDPLYQHFSRLHQSTFNDAAKHFPENSIDLLHIDGSHDYDSVKQDVETWLPKLSDDAVLLLHDTQVITENFGVHQLFHELKARYPHFEFPHAYGLGILAVGKNIPPAFQQFLSHAAANPAPIHRYFATLGHALDQTRTLHQLTMQLNLQTQITNRYRHSLGTSLLAPIPTTKTVDPKSHHDHLVHQSTTITADLKHATTHPAKTEPVA